MSTLHVEINRFSGPMALLLHLIRQQEMDIFDINIHEITKYYLDSIQQMKQLDLEMAGDFVAMAATLIQIKSKMLLPQYNDDGDVIETEDPRKELVQRLIEYHMFQEAGQTLYQRPLLNRDVWARGETEKISLPESEVVLPEENALYALISSYKLVLKNAKKVVHKVAVALQSVKDRISEIKSRLVVGQNVRFFELLPIGSYAQDRRGQMLITFLSLLELGKMGFVQLFQSDNFEDIHIQTKKPIDGDVLSQVEDYQATTDHLDIDKNEWASQWVSVEANEQEEAPINALMPSATDEEIEKELASQSESETLV